MNRRNGISPGSAPYSRRRRTAVVMLALLAAVACGAATDFTKPKAKGFLTGKLRGLTYTAPKDLFRLSSPVDGDWGGIVEDQAGYVAFSDDAGQLFRIEYTEYTEDFDRARAQLGDRKFFEQLLSGFYLPKTILAAFPETKFIAQSFVESPAPLLITCWFIPKGSTIVNYHDGKSERLDTFRSVAVLVRKPRLYFVSLSPSTGKVASQGENPAETLWP